MKQKPSLHAPIANTEIEAYRGMLASCLNLAVEDLKLEAGHPNRVEAEEFFWGHNSAVSTKYLHLLGIDPTRFMTALKAKVAA